MLIQIANWLIAIYFIILFFERTRSIVLSVKDPNVKLFANGFHAYTNLVTILSLVGFLVVLIGWNWLYVTSLFTGAHFAIDLKMLCVAIGVILLGGMVHTEHTNAPVQFGSYGALIVAMILYTINYRTGTTEDVLLWISLVFLIAFSMAIPVMYESNIKAHTVFHILEAITAPILVFMFCYMTYLVFIGDAVNLFFIPAIVAATVLDAIIIAMRWKESKNWFVLVALVLSIVLWIAGTIVSVIMYRG